MNRRRLLGLPALAAPLLAGLLGLSACANPPPPPPTLALTIAAGADQNPDTTGTATPVKVFIFQLSATGKFEKADVFALTERAQATLGAEMLAVEDVVVRPGETRVVQRELKNGTQFIGTVVFFRDIDRATWRGIAPVPGTGTVKMRLSTKGNTATLAVP